jgi:DNA-binding MarR family transcriptional regulator
MARKNAIDLPLLLGNQLCFAIYSTAHTFNRVYKPLLDRLGLTYPQYLAMLVLWERDGLSVKEIGERLFLDSGTLTPLLKRLEAAGLIERTRDPEDERQVRITLTKPGRALKRKAHGVPLQVLCASGQTAEGLMQLRGLLSNVRDELIRYGNDESASDATDAADCRT